MAIAPFIDKIAQSASTLLAGFDAPRFIERLDRLKVAVAVDSHTATTAEGRVATEMLVDLLSRLYPHVDVVTLDNKEESIEFGALLRRRALEINPSISTSERIDRDAFALVVAGSTSPADDKDGQRPTIYMGSDGWVARLSSNRSVGFGSTTNPFGAAAAACIAAANVFRLAFGAQLPSSSIDGETSLSLFNYSTTAESQDNPSLPQAIDLGEAFLVGTGAIGHGFASALRKMSGLRGVLHLVDDDYYDSTNPQRYAGVEAAIEGQLKVEYVAAKLRASASPDLLVNAHPTTWDGYLSQRNDWNLQRVALALDSAEDRVFAQGSLPRKIFNSWTQASNLGVSRHDFLETACVACLYPIVATPDLDDLVADALRFPEGQLMLVRKLLDTAQPLDRAMLARIAAQVGVPVDVLMEFDGAPLIALYQRAACGGSILRWGGQLGSAIREVEVPMAFQSALAGVMLAAEVVLDAIGAKRELPVRTEVNLLRPLSGTLSSPEAKRADGRCICQDPDFVAAYREKYTS